MHASIQPFIFSSIHLLSVGSLKVWARAVAEAPLHCLRLSAHAALARARRRE